MDDKVRAALNEGLADAAGFVLGALAGWGLGRLTGFDFLASPGYGWREMVGLALIAIGCGLGKKFARQFVAARKASRP